MTENEHSDIIETDDGPGKRAAKGVVMRQCALGREPLPTSEMIRFVLSPDGQVTPDLKRVLPGRGVWLRARKPVVAEAVKRKLFSRGFKQQAACGEDLPRLIQKLLFSEALRALSLANKAGLVLTGYEKIRDAIGKARIVALLHAEGASLNGSDKLDRLIAPRAADEETPRPAVLIMPPLFTSDELSLALGRGNVVHVGLQRGGAAARFIEATERAAAYQAEEGVALSNG